MSCHLDLRGQYANQNLLSSEQMSVGGYSTVRGYAERQLNGDSAIIFNGELRSKEWHFFSIDKKNRDSFQILGFYDYGIAYAHKTTSGEKHSQFIQSIGPGLRYYFNPYVTARLDLGFQLKNLKGISHDQHHKWHFGCVASY